MITVYQHLDVFSELKFISFHNFTKVKGKFFRVGATIWKEYPSIKLFNYFIRDSVIEA
jgi:hypothetical protein